MAGQTESIGSNVEKVKVLVAQSCLTLCDPMDCSPPGSSVHGILQARMLEWVAMPSPGDLPDTEIESRSPALQAGSLPSEPQVVFIIHCSIINFPETPWLRTTHIFYCAVFGGQKFRRGLAGWFWDRVSSEIWGKMLTGNELIRWLDWGWRIGYGWEFSIPHPTALPLGHLSVFLAHSWLSLDWVIPGRRQGEGHQAFYHLISEITHCYLYNFLLIHWVQPTLRGWGIKCYFLKGEGPQETCVSGRQKDAETFNNN